VDVDSLYLYLYRFILPALQLQFILEQVTKRKRREALMRLPIGLFDMYTITFDRIRQQPPSQAEMAMSIFTWLYLAKRILKVYELQHALAVQAGDTALVEDGIPPEETLLECCLGLVVIERETSTIRFAHFTLQEYLNEHWQKLFPKGHSTIASTCCTYLSFESPDSDDEEWEDAPTLLDYAANFLGDHLREDTNEELNHQTLKLLADEAKFQLLKFHLREWDCQECPSHLYWAAYFGIPSLAVVLLQTSNYSIDMRDNTGRAPLSYAASMGHAAVVKLLLGVEGVDVESRDQIGWTPLATQLQVVMKQSSSYCLEWKV
jgi:hypothetical protein